MAKTKVKSRRRNGGMKIPVAVIGGFAPLVMNTWSTAGGMDRKLWMVTQALTGYDTDAKKFWLPNLNKGMTWILLGALVHMVANRLGINRALSSVPLLRI